MTVTETELRLDFFDYLFDKCEGFLSIAHSPARNRNKFEEKFFAWPDQKDGVNRYIEHVREGNNVWFSINLFRRPKRSRDFAVPNNLVWADLDFCDPSEIEPPPQCRIRTSPQRWQGIWRLEEIIDPLHAQTLSKRIAYAYADKGADKSGWDAEQLLRVPFTYNYKYDDGSQFVPEVELITSFEVLLPVTLFEESTPEVAEERVEGEVPMPNIQDLPDVSNVYYSKRNELRGTPFDDLFANEPKGEWSGQMWQLLNICFEAGMDREEVFAIALQAKCNKYKRDGRPIKWLWREVLKAELKQKTIHLVLGEEAKPLEMPTLVDQDEPHSIVVDYKKWAVMATDAVEEYHELACTIMLSSLLSGSLYLNTSFGKVIPNLWGLILGESTLTRKTTAMKMAMQFVGEIERELVVASDGSVEGILTALSARPNKVSVFYKDEVSGFFDSINRKDYLSGMAETFTHLYDVPEYYPRQLRKETITLTKPVFIFFGGGIREKTYAALTDEDVVSGFLPRFLVVNGDADVSRIRPTGPLAPAVGDKRVALRERLVELHTIYNAEVEHKIPEANTSFTTPIQTEVVLTDEAWKFFNKIEMQLAESASDSSIKMVADPTFARLAWSSLKMAMLFAAARQEPKDDQIEVKVGDLRVAAWYIQRWGRHSIDLIQNVGRSANQRLVNRILEQIKRNASSGITRSAISRNNHLNKKELDLILETLNDRGQIRIQKQGNGQLIFPV